MKNERQRIILDLISSKDIETQYQLIEALSDAGVKSTQATLSRDIRELHLIKELTPRGTYRYAAPQASASVHSEKLRSIFRQSVTNAVCAQNIVVVKTLPGLASAACSALDKLELDNIAGTLAGDDTAFVAMVDNESAKALCREILDNIK